MPLSPAKSRHEGNWLHFNPPIWWYVAPTIINTFVESYDFSGKTIVPFATSGGSGMGKTVEVLKTLCPTANWEKGKMLNRVSDQELTTWVNGL